VALVMLLLSTGCSGRDHAGQPGATEPSSSAGSSPPPPRSHVDPQGFPMPERPACASDAGGRFETTSTSGGRGVGIILLGHGAGGVVLGPQDDGDICQWLPFAEVLAARYRVALFDWADPRDDVPRLAAAALRRAGARRIVLGGASFGGATAMSVAHAVAPAPVGVVSLGGELSLPGHDFRPGIRRWHGPLLEVSSEDDHFFDSADAARLRDLHPGPERIVMLPGSAHGVDLLDGRHARRVRAAIERFLASVLR
jgi:hypothetical protein